MNRDYKYNPSTVSMLCVFGLIFLFLCFITFMAIGHFVFLWQSILFLFMSFLLNFTTLKIRKEYCEIKIAIVRGAKFIRYRDLKSINNEKNKKLIITTKDGKKIKFPLNNIEKSKRKEVINLLNDKISKEKQVKTEEGNNKLKELYAEVKRLYQNGDVKKANTLAESILYKVQKECVPNHPLVATSMSNLAKLYSAQGDYTKAEPLYKDALNIRKKMYGTDHPMVSDSIRDLKKCIGNTIQLNDLYN